MEAERRETNEPAISVNGRHRSSLISHEPVSLWSDLYALIKHCCGVFMSTRPRLMGLQWPILYLAPVHSTQTSSELECQLFSSTHPSTRCLTLRFCFSSVLFLSCAESQSCRDAQPPTTGVTTAHVHASVSLPVPDYQQIPRLDQ